MGGKGAGKAPPPPPKLSASEAKEAKEALREKERERVQAEKARGEAAIAALKDRARLQHDLQDRVTTTCVPMSIVDVPWASAHMFVQIAGMALEEAGHGVFVMEFEGGGCVILRDHHLTTDLTACSVADVLGIRVAQSRLVHGGEAERSAIQEAWGGRGKDDAAVFSVAVLEFIPGLTLDRAKDRLSAASSDQLLAIGQLCALDALLNNMDRVPLPLWDNDVGNLSNIMMGHDGSVVGIDQQVQAIRDESAKETYISRVCALAERLMAEDYMHVSLQAVCQKMSDKIEQVVGVQLSQKSLITILKGMREGFLKIQRCWDSGALQSALAAAVETARSIRSAPPILEETADVYAAWVLLVAEAVVSVMASSQRV